MMAVLEANPLGCVMAYDPAFKVEVCQCDPLYGMGTSEKDILLDVMAVSVQLDLLVRKELVRSENGKIDRGRVSRSFETKAMVMMKRIKTALKNLPSPSPSPEEYMETTGLSKLYPRAAAYIAHPSDISIALRTTQMDGYFAFLGNIHQVVTLAHQINSDVTNLRNHKYIAHQVVLLHQSLGLFGDNATLKEFKSNVEENFEVVKAALTSDQEHKDVRLSAEHAQWLLEVTSGVVHEAASLSHDVAPKLALPAHVLVST